jgi:nicotinamidase/pyrazinamidase
MRKGNDMKKLRTVLIIIDGQNCFMYLPGSPLPVRGSIEDMLRLVYFIGLFRDQIDHVIASLDTHTADHISHPERWVDVDGNHPAPYTAITYEDCLTGVWRAANPVDQDWQLEYVRQLKRTHYIWPVHGQKPEWEWQLFPALERELSQHPSVQYVEKGMHRDVEQFGIFGAEVPFPDAPGTDINHALIAQIDSFDRIIFAGEAASHCVMDSVNQFLKYMPSQDPTKVVLLQDCMSPVTGFEELTAKWLDEMDAIGVNVATSIDYAATQSVLEKP